MEIDIEARVDKAKRLFSEGKNCSQSVFMALADILEIDEKLAFKLSLPFGGGMGGQREVCGCVSAAFMCTGLVKSTKTENYLIVRELTERFKSENGSILCKELLGLVSTPMPLKKKPCSEYVAFATRLLGEKLKEW
jgi:C_GCAxxG_C_C family probable redox protein